MEIETPDCISLGKLCVFTEILTAGAKAAVLALEGIKAEALKFVKLIGIRKSELIANLLEPHGIAGYVYGVIAPLSVNAKIAFPMLTIPYESIDCIKNPQNVTARERYDTVTSRAFWDFFKANDEDLTIISDFGTWNTYKRHLENLPESYRLNTHRIKKLVLVSDFQDVIGSWKNGTLGDLEIDSPGNSQVVHIITIPEIGMIMYKKGGDTYVLSEGTQIEDGPESVRISVGSNVLFKEYFQKPKSTSSAFKSGRFTRDYEKPIQAKNLLKNHKDYVLYFKKRRDRMSRYPQGYIKRVPIRTQFWGNFTGRNRNYTLP
ncbi:hypothetical protein BEWA_045890 [Theileria equi strain WA]|uniref:Uncharacterized protein n=1 Tax=Theileria equi strain WA TaxID=1537102 RepID=L1LA64_THEEQ|nr:hypothetical protein BEWA_045890 [Theileria equi strain WA]EKX72125.1 hypothetical protein BEWA_045890 [Theileria equi strain WA]|eukprot:XP_004831577.1 hypothetical protein BEWA_045890 [Theileria equi strain WA]